MYKLMLEKKNNADNDLLTQTWVIKTRQMKYITLIVDGCRIKKIQDWRRPLAKVSKLPFWLPILHPTCILTHHLYCRALTLMDLCFSSPLGPFAYIYLSPPYSKNIYKSIFWKFGIQRILVHLPNDLIRVSFWAVMVFGGTGRGTAWRQHLCFSR